MNTPLVALCLYMCVCAYTLPTQCHTISLSLSLLKVMGVVCFLNGEIRMALNMAPHYS